MYSVGFSWLFLMSITSAGCRLKQKFRCVGYRGITRRVKHGIPDMGGKGVCLYMYWIR